MNDFPVALSDQALADYNEALPWFSGTVLPDGRILGKVGARANKRDTVQVVPDKRIVRLDEAVDLSDKSVLEIGCFEGIHTLGLCLYCPDVTAIDVRPLNVIKTLTRLSAYGRSAKVYPLDIEGPLGALPHFDVVFHCGVLYHLENPVSHLLSILGFCDAIYLDTHVAEVGRNADVLVHEGRTYHGYRHTEGGWLDPFSGRASAAFWLLPADIERLLIEQGFSCETWSERAERNGARVGLLGKRPDGSRRARI